MGTALTGTEIKDTYDSLLKISDNGPISGTAKYLSDCLGNDSVLSLSTAAVGVGTASNSYTAAGRGNLNIAGSGGAILGFQIGGSPKGYVFHDNTTLQLWNEVAGDLLFGANATERMRITSAGNVGIGTSSPSTKLHVSDSGAVGVNVTSSASQAYMNFTSVNTAGFEPFIGFGGTSAGDQAQMIGVVNGGVRWTVAGSEAMRINSSGNVGIGESSPSTKLELLASASVNLTGNTYYSARFLQDKTNYRGVFFGYDTTGTIGVIGAETASPASALAFYTYSGSSWGERARVTTNGLTFNGDTAAANALDDYEEGTFTAYLVPPTSGTITLDPTYSTWSYTKIGRKVTINGVAVISAVSSPVGPYFTMTTLPFTIITANSGYGSGSAILSDQSLSYAKSSVPIWHSVGNVSLNFALDASTLGAGDELYVTATYFV